MSIKINNIDKDTLYTVSELKEILNYKRSNTIYRMIKKHNIKTVNFNNKTYISGSEILNIINEQINK